MTPARTEWQALLHYERALLRAEPPIPELGACLAHLHAWQALRKVADDVAQRALVTGEILYLKPEIDEWTLTQRVVTRWHDFARKLRGWLARIGMN